MSFAWFLPFVGCVYSALLVIVIGWLAQRAAKALRPGLIAGGETGEWIASVLGATAGFLPVLLLTHGFKSAPMLGPLLSLASLFCGSLTASLWLRSISQWLRDRAIK